jgi:uncharacterized membrane protein
MATIARHRDGVRTGSAPMPTGVVIASYRTYADAQRAVDYLSDNKFPVENLTIVGNDVHIVEIVTGRLTWAKVLLGGAATGAWTGLFIGLLIGLFAGSPASWVAIIIGAVLIGAVWGMVLSAVGYAATGGKRDFSSIPGLSATQFDIVADPTVADRAREVLTAMR